MAKAKKKTSRSRTRAGSRRPRDLAVRSTRRAAVKGGDEVLVAFAHGDLRAPVAMGKLWGSGDRPPTSRA